MRILGIILIILAIVFALSLVIGVISLPGTVQSDAANRTVEQSVVFGLTPQDVHLDMPLAQYAECQEGPKPLDAVLLIDQSGSMGGDPLDQALAGSLLLIQSLDLDRHQVAIGLFADQVSAYQGLTMDHESLMHVLDQSNAGFETNIAEALKAAHNELQGVRRRFGSDAMVILFTDGGTGVATINEVERLAASLKNAGVKIFVIGLQGDDFDEALLRSVASAPEYLRISPSPQELAGIFRNIAEEINQVVATDMTVAESLASALPIVPNSVTPPGTLTSSQLLWEFTTINKDAVAGWGSFSYQILPDAYGLYQLAPQAGHVNFDDCESEAVSFESPAGPRLLILPPLPLTILPLLLLFLLGLFLFWLGRRQSTPKSPRITPMPTAQVASDTPIEPIAPSSGGALFMNWFNKADNLTSDIGRTPDAPVRHLPTLIIGVGVSGRVVLKKMAVELEERWGTTLPERVRLLQVNVPLGNSSPDDFNENLTEVSLERRGERLSTSESHVQWARDLSKRSGRPAGRIALFADLTTGKNESQLYPALRKVLNGQRASTVWIVSDAFSDDGSSIVADVGHLVRTLALPNEIGSVRLCLATHNARWSDRLGPQQRSQRSFATLRELLRLRQKRETPFVYVSGLGQRELEALNRDRLFDEIYLFDGKGEETHGTAYDISALPAEDGVLTVMANGLLAFLDPTLSQRFLELEKNAQTEVARTGSTKLEDYVSAMGCCVVRVPIEALRQLAELRLVHHALFDNADGLFGWERLENDGTINQRKEVNVSVKAQDLDDFQRQTGLALDSGGAQTPEQLRAKVLQYFDSHMNDGEPLRLRWAFALITQVIEKQPTLAPALDPFKEELDSWINLVGKIAAPKPKPDTQSFDSMDFDFDFDLDLPMFDEDDSNSEPAGTLYNEWVSDWQDASASFSEQKAQSPDTSVVSLKDEPAIFRRYLSPIEQHAARLRKRTYWLWQDRQGNVSLRLLVLPNDLSARPANERVKSWSQLLRENPHAYACSANDAEKVLKRMQRAAGTQSRAINGENVMLYLDRQSQVLTQTLRQNSSPLFRRKELGSSDGVAATPYRYMLAPAGEAGDRIAASLDAIRLEGSDPSTIVMMQVKHILPIANTEAFSEARSAYIPLRNLHVFLAEQRATEMEHAAQQELIEESEPLLFPPEVVALLDGGQESIELIGESMIYGLLVVRSDGESETLMATNPAFDPLSRLDVSRLLLEGIPLLQTDADWFRTLRNILDEERQNNADRRYELMNEVRLKQLPTLLALPSDAGQELAIVLAAAIQRESMRS